MIGCLYQLPVLKCRLLIRIHRERLEGFVILCLASWIPSSVGFQFESIVNGRKTLSYTARALLQVYFSVDFESFTILIPGVVQYRMFWFWLKVLPRVDSCCWKTLLAHTSSLHALSLYVIILYKRFVFGHICIIRAQNLLLCRVLDILTRIQISSLVYCKFLIVSTFQTPYVDFFF